MRRFLFLAIILTFFILGGMFFVAPERMASSQEDPYLLLCRIMQLADASIAEGELHYWASLGTCPEIASLPDLEARADELLKRISRREPLKAARDKEDFAVSPGTGTGALHDDHGQEAGDGSPAYMIVERHRELNSGGQLRLLLQHMEQEDSKVVHLLITVTKEGEAPELSSMACRLPALLGQEIEEGNLSLCLTGHLAGKLDTQEMEALARNVAQKIGGEGLQSVSDGQMVSVTGYTPDLGDYLRAENLRINLNLALRYDDYLDKTVLWVGTPLITRSY
ncbi:MAG: YwmB family TATA-box binding protein [Dethiobacteria bacterium]